MQISILEWIIDVNAIVVLCVLLRFIVVVVAVVLRVYIIATSGIGTVPSPPFEFFKRGANWPLLLLFFSLLFVLLLSLSLISGRDGEEAGSLDIAGKVPCFRSARPPIITVDVVLWEVKRFERLLERERCWRRRHGRKRKRLRLVRKPTAVAIVTAAGFVASLDGDARSHRR